MNIIQSLGGLETPGPDWSERDTEPVTKEKYEGQRGLVGLRGVGLHTKESPDVMNPEGHAAGTSA